MEMVPAAIVNEITAQRDWALTRAATIVGELAKYAEEVQRLQKVEAELREELAKYAPPPDLPEEGSSTLD